MLSRPSRLPWAPVAAAPPGAAAVDAVGDTPIDDGEDGPPVRQPCVTPTGTALAKGTYGRLDGILVAVSTPGSRTNDCNPDNDHVHLQIRANGAIYDIAVNVDADVHSQTLDRRLFDPPWSEGWHTGPDIFVEYPGLGLHADTMPLPGPGELIPAVTAELATANHVSVYATGYAPNGAHLVHRNHGGDDGLIVTHPLAAAAHERAFSFTGQAF